MTGTGEGARSWGSRPVVVAAGRSPIGRAYKGRLTGIRPDDLAAQVVAATLRQIPAFDPAETDDLLVGCGLPGGEQGFNIARIVAILLGLDTVPGATVNRYCASSLQTTRMAMHAVMAGEARAVISAGVESVSRLTLGSPDSVPGTRNPILDQAVPDGGSPDRPWTDPRRRGAPPQAYLSMGQTAENVATVTGTTRAEMDEFAARSQQLVQQRIAQGFFAREIVPVTGPDGTVLDADESPRAGTTVDTLSALPPAFRPDGLVTAGNSCPLNDGAAALVVTSPSYAAELGLAPVARIVASAVSGLSPEIMGLGPVSAAEKALATAGLQISDIDLVEINEAFAAQVVPSARLLDVPIEKLNVNGGAIALGHPFGMTGARLIQTMANSLRFHDKHLGLVALCVGGGQGMAMIVERAGR